MLSSLYLFPFLLKIFLNPYTICQIWCCSNLIKDSCFGGKQFWLLHLMRLKIIANNSLMRRVLWGSQHIGEATPGLIKSKKAKQKVKIINFLLFFSHKYVLKCQSCFSCHSCWSCLSYRSCPSCLSSLFCLFYPSCLNCPWHFSTGIVAKRLPIWLAWKVPTVIFVRGLDVVLKKGCLSHITSICCLWQGSWTLSDQISAHCHVNQSELPTVNNSV